MWEYEHQVETTAEAEAVWARWTDVATWPEWNDGVERVRIDGPFGVGTKVTMTPPGEEPIEMTLTEVQPGRQFTDEVDAGDVLVRTRHLLEPLDDGRLRVVYRMEITGPAADELGPTMGPAITADFPDVVAKLLAVAER